MQLLRRDALPVQREPGVVARLYSGESGGLRSTTKNHAPVTIVDVSLAAGASFTQSLPTSYNGFLYVLEGEVRLGEQAARLGDVGWLERPTARPVGESHVRLTAGDEPARVVLYAGEPQNEPLLHHGPFVAESEAELGRLFARYRVGTLRGSASSASRGSGRERRSPWHREVSRPDGGCWTACGAMGT